MRNYSDLLPSYLDGENIQKHSSLIERSDRYLDGLVELFGLWDKLERPILIKREQSSYNGVNTVTLYVNTPAPITEIIIEGDIEETITPEDTVTTSYEGTWTITNPSIEVIGNGIYLPELLVTVRTETHTYTKAYPENDTIENNSADHDIFLDIVGGLLGIPRRQYMEWNNYFEEKTEPPYFAKQVIDLTFLECSEDDYYYKERLQYFINTTDNLRLFRTIYDKDVLLLNPKDFTIGGISSSANVLFVHIIRGSINNDNKINIDTTNIQEIAEQSLPITRQTLVLPYGKLVRYAVVKSEYVNFLRIHLTVGLRQKTIGGEPSTEVPLANLPLKISYADGTELGTFITDETGTAHINIDGARSGQRTLKWDVTREYPYFEVTTILGGRDIPYNASLFKLSLSDDAWQYKKLRGTSVTSFEEPTILQNENLNCGRGYIPYTPAINPTLVDLSAYTMTVQFHYTNSNQSFRLGGLVTYDDDTATVNGINTTPRSYDTANPDISDTHYLKYKFLDGICYVYYDDVYTGQSFDFNSTTNMIYLAGFNYRANPSTAGLHIHGVSVDNSVDIDTPPQQE